MPSRRTLLAAALLAVAVPAGGTWADATKTVAITQIIEHPALDAARRGILEELEAAGYEPGRNLELIYASAHGDPAGAAEVARRFAAARPDVIVPISTPSAQAVVAATDDIPVVFTAVTDPLGAGLVDDLARPGGNVTGMTDLSPIRRHLDLIREITPAVRRLGVIHNPDEANAVSLLRLLAAEAPARDLSIVRAAVPHASAVAAAARRLAGETDAFYVPTDNTVIGALEAILEVGAKHRLPVYAGDIEAVPRGALAALGFNYYDIGRQTGYIVLRVLRGEKPGDIPVQGVETTELYVNRKAAEAMGVTLPDAVLKRARRVIE